MVKTLEKFGEDTQDTRYLGCTATRATPKEEYYHGYDQGCEDTKKTFEAIKGIQLEFIARLAISWLKNAPKLQHTRGCQCHVCIVARKLARALRPLERDEMALCIGDTQISDARKRALQLMQDDIGGTQNEEPPQGNTS